MSRGILLNDMHPPFSVARIMDDNLKIEQLANLMSEMNLMMDPLIMEAFQKLHELAGSREFLPLYSPLLDMVLKLQTARFKTGYIIPWVHLYRARLGYNSHLLAIANHHHHCSPPLKPATSSPSNSRASKSLFSKTFINPYGMGSNPVELDRGEWEEILQRAKLYSRRSTYNLERRRHRFAPLASPLETASMGWSSVGEGSGNLKRAHDEAEFSDDNGECKKKDQSAHAAKKWNWESPVPIVYGDQTASSLDSKNSHLNTAPAADATK